MFGGCSIFLENNLFKFRFLNHKVLEKKSSKMVGVFGAKYELPSCGSDTRQLAWSTSTLQEMRRRMLTCTSSMELPRTSGFSRQIYWTRIRSVQPLKDALECSMLQVPFLPITPTLKTPRQELKFPFQFQSAALRLHIYVFHSSSSDQMKDALTAETSSSNANAIALISM